MFPPKTILFPVDFSDALRGRGTHGRDLHGTL